MAVHIPWFLWESHNPYRHTRGNMKAPRSQIRCSTTSHRLAVVVATMLLILLLSCCPTTLAQELIEPPSEPDPSCLDNDAMIQHISGNPLVTCERLAKNGRCTSNCQPLSQTCCISCGPICAADIANSDADASETTLPAKKQPQLSRYCEVLVTLPNSNNDRTRKKNVVHCISITLHKIHDSVDRNSVFTKTEILWAEFVGSASRECTKIIPR